MTPQELGPYLLLRKLSENALCETYRAGQRSGQEVERVVLLYFFNTDPSDAQWLAETAHAGRRALSGLESPSVPAAVDSGEIAGTAYLTYDYIPGRSLEIFLEKARALESAIPIEHALLITDRIAQGLQAAWDHESRALHGFVVPQLVMLSNEGDVQLLGLEVASRLRKLLAEETVRAEMGRYLAPEVVPEGQPSTTDDVFSLGAILFELVTGRELPADGESLAEAITQARTLDGQALPATIVELLRTSLTTSFGRSDLKSWRSQLSGLLTSGEFDANAFNLALFLHTLFGSEIESEDEEALGEGALLGAAQADAPTVARIDAVEHEQTFPEAADAVPDEVSELPVDLVEEAAATAPKRGRFLAIAAGVVLVAAAGFSAFKLFGPSEGTGDIALQSVEPVPLTSPEATQPTDSTLDPAVDLDLPTEEEAALSPEEIDQRVQELLSQRSADMESSLRQEFESELADLRRQLLAAQERAATAEEAQTAAEAPEEALPDQDADVLRIASNELAAEADSVLLPPDESTRTEAIAEADDDTFAAVESEVVVEDAPSIDDRTGVETTDLPALDTAGGEQRPAEALQASTQPAREPVREDPETEPERIGPAGQSSPADPVDSSPRVEVGDLVTQGPGVTLPRIAEPAQPVYPMMARRLRKSAVVTVKVLVDENGRVTQAERLSDEAGYGFDNAAVDAALKTRFEPATKEGVPVKIWWTVRIAFRP
jgi:TonB family protein